MTSHAIIVNFDSSDEEPYTVGAFSIVRSLTNLNVETTYFDNTHLDLDIDEVQSHSILFDLVSRLIKDTTKFLGFSVISSNVDISLDCAAFIKKRYPNILIGFGGVFIGSHSFTEDYKARFEDIDFYVNGKGDDLIKKIIGWNFELNQFEESSGLSFRRGDRFYHDGGKVEFLDYKPISYSPRKDDPSYVETSFSVGCPYRCSFCSQHFVFPNFIRTDVEECIEELRPHKGKTILITDALVNSNHKWLGKLCSRIIEEDLNLIWHSWFRVSQKMNDLNFLNLLYESGCRVIIFGLESASSAVLKHMKKFHDVTQIYQIFDKVRQLNKSGKYLTIHLNIIAGYPTETEEDFQKTYVFLKKNSDVISDVSINPALLNLELKDFKKLFQEGKVIEANSIHDWSTASSTPKIRLERLNRLRDLLKACNIKHAIHNEKMLIDVVNNPKTPTVVKEERNPWEEAFKDPQGKSEMLIFPSLEVVEECFDVRKNIGYVLTSQPTLLSRLFDRSENQKFAVYYFLKKELTNRGIQGDCESVNFLVLLCLKRFLFLPYLKKINKFLNLLLPGFSFHGLFVITYPVSSTGLDKADS